MFFGGGWGAEWEKPPCRLIPQVRALWGALGGWGDVPGGDGGRFYIGVVGCH